eukprot:CAMPEP_0198683436 /NCGR_PEP_ID=MMETSP1468-20131203/10648_1 /TAXON_ID=1461545 /ORGANISM="Mantoniella sp, Strain CCMP1436" /LENGTH=124 /DNA_ID=CAMNT_0044427453 /DNA_START=118 /DNA_END=488 /DNA_ORIENTATION=-
MHVAVLNMWGHRRCSLTIVGSVEVNPLITHRPPLQRDSAFVFASHKWTRFLPWDFWVRMVRMYSASLWALTSAFGPLLSVPPSLDAYDHGRLGPGVAWRVRRLSLAAILASRSTSSSSGDPTWL